MENKAIIATPSIYDENRWFVFRENGQEVVVLMKHGKIEASSHELHDYEKLKLVKMSKKTPLPVVNNLPKRTLDKF